jgi:short subunit dehydrogenase-like uncharacterized protein
MAKKIVAVFGGTGYTGRFVVRELLRREIRPVAIARHPAAFAAAGFADSEVECRQATVDDPVALDQALYEAQAVINCAGPFVDTADATVSAALRAGIHYVDVAAEQISVARTLEQFDKPAHTAGVVVVPSMAYFGGLSDLMATAVLEDWDRVDSIEVMNGFDSWHPTLGTRNTIARKSVGNLMVTGGRLTEVPSPPAQKRWSFAEPIGDQAVIELPLAETVLN